MTTHIVDINITPDFTTKTVKFCAYETEVKADGNFDTLTHRPDAIIDVRTSLTVIDQLKEDEWVQSDGANALPKELLHRFYRQR